LLGDNNFASRSRGTTVASAGAVIAYHEECH